MVTMDRTVTTVPITAVPHQETMTMSAAATQIAALTMVTISLQRAITIYQTVITILYRQRLLVTHRQLQLDIDHYHQYCHRTTICTRQVRHRASGGVGVE